MSEDKTILIKTEAHDVKWVEPLQVTAKQATEMKGYPHPGNEVKFNGGYSLPLQFGESPLSVRNGLLTSEILRGLIDYYRVYQTPGNPMASRETALMITKLEEALHWSEARQLDRQFRDVRFTDEP